MPATRDLNAGASQPETHGAPARCHRGDPVELVPDGQPAAPADAELERRSAGHPEVPGEYRVEIHFDAAGTLSEVLARAERAARGVGGEITAVFDTHTWDEVDG
jgi:hypothetical protein